MALGKIFNNRITHFLSHTAQFFSSLQNYGPPVLKNFPINSRICRNYASCDDGDSKQGDTAKTKEQQVQIFRHGYAEEVEGAVNHQILDELNASMIYLSMFCYYGRTDIALPGCQMFFRRMYDEEQEHAMEFINYQLMRGGQVHLFPLTIPEDTNWTDITVALGVALELEKRVKEKLEGLAKIAEKHKDAQLLDLVTSKFMAEQNKSICEMGRLLTNAKRLVDTGGVGRHLFDRELMKHVSTSFPEVKIPFYI
ncbi:hypothetical protein MTP99_012194 [Tenebrio molitor]|jgi:ferritin heavy chain|nr:hypothetical protein MTP99_012194 [Tenebrio molitor]CAH1370635.1 unnamed protein product [Tenebrio molitor]